MTADVTTDAFNRPDLWDDQRAGEVKLSSEELPKFKEIIESLTQTHSNDFKSKFIAESPDRIRRFYHYYSAYYNQSNFPEVRCNAPWVSTVIEADGSVRPCFFHEVIGDIREASLADIMNSEKSISFRKNLDVQSNSVCKKCVCSLNLSPFAKF